MTVEPESVPISEEEFYHRRGDRTRQLTDTCQYQTVRTALTCSEAVARRHIGQIMLICSANLLARWSRQVWVDVPDAPLHPNLRVDGCKTLHERLQEETHQANPFIIFDVQSPNENAATLGVGRECGAATYAVGVDGWCAVGWQPGSDAPPSPSSSSFVPAGMLAASLGTAQLFKHAVGQPDSQLLSRFCWHLWNHQMGDRPDRSSSHIPQVPKPQNVDVGTVLQVGVGAVGSNLVYFLGMAGMDATMTLLDYDVVEVENLDRSLLFGVKDAVPKEKQKVRTAQDYLERCGYSDTTVFPRTWDEYVREGLNPGSFDLWLALANEQGVWASMAENAPPLCMQATTSTTWGFGLGRHIPFHDYCLRCRFPTGENELETRCSVGQMEVPTGNDTEDTQEIHPSLPFLSAGAAALLVGELAKASLVGYRQCPNYVEANVKQGLERVLALQRPPQDSCPVCQQSSRSVWERINDYTKYAHLSL